MLEHHGELPERVDGFRTFLHGELLPKPDRLLEFAAAFVLVSHLSKGTPSRGTAETTFDSSTVVLHRALGLRSQLEDPS
jgi:hypothetical protein